MTSEVNIIICFAFGSTAAIACFLFKIVIFAVESTFRSLWFFFYLHHKCAHHNSPTCEEISLEGLNLCSFDPCLVPAAGPCSEQSGPTHQRAANPDRGASVGHGEDPSQREQAECTSDRDPGEGMDLLFYLSASEVIMKSNVTISFGISGE